MRQIRTRNIPLPVSGTPYVWGTSSSRVPRKPRASDSALKWFGSKSRSLARNRVEDLLCMAHPQPGGSCVQHDHRVFVIEDAAAGFDAHGWSDRGPDQHDIMNGRAVTEVTRGGLDERSPGLDCKGTARPLLLVREPRAFEDHLDRMATGGVDDGRH